MKIGVLTSSRADFGIYLPLLTKLKENSFFNIEIIAFGSHLSYVHGFTVSEIEKQGFDKLHRISVFLSNDDEVSIATSYAITALKFAEFWSNNKYELVFCLGDRFEMNAAVQAGIPFCIKFAHFHGGETTLGALDNIYRHQISHASTFHFTSTDTYSKKIEMLKGDDKNVFTVGSLSLDGIEHFIPIEKSVFYDKYAIKKEDFALITFHPETVAQEKNAKFALEMRIALSKISEYLFLVITMPNADTMGNVFRRELYSLKSQFPDRIVCIENFGKVNYFNALYYARILVGNTSSGIIEAASFNKYVINVGQRQEGRVHGTNVFNCSFDEAEIIKTTDQVLSMEQSCVSNVYYNENTIVLVEKILKEIYEKS